LLRTAICNLFNIEHPTIQRGMAWAVTHELVAAVSSAGGLGLFDRGHVYLRATEGELDQGSLLAGQVAGMISEIKPVRAIIEEMVTHAEFILQQMCPRFVHE